MTRRTTARREARGNQVLDALPVAERDALVAEMTAVDLPIKTVLFEPGAPIEAVYFPTDGVISLVTPLDDGNVVEVATIGNEGIVGVPHMDGGSLAVRAVCQVAGSALRMDGRSFASEWEHPGPLRDLVQSYLQALFGQVSQAAACNRLHSNEERLSRWLLMSHDRVQTDEFLITLEFLGRMLGSPRATVTLSAGILQAAGLIKYRRGELTIVDRDGLEEVSCECYGVIKLELDRVLHRAAGRAGQTA